MAEKMSQESADRINEAVEQIILVFKTVQETFSEQEAVLFAVQIQKRMTEIGM